MKGWLLDGRYALRQIRRSPGFVTAVVLCLAIGIGANTIVFDLTRGMLSPSSAVHDPDGLVRIYTRWASGEVHSSFSWPDYEDVRDRATTLSSIATWTIRPFHLSVEGVSERIWGQGVSGNYFHTLGVGLAAGRDLRPQEYAERGTHPVLLISHGLWQRRFGGDPEAVGSRVLLNGHPFTIVGVVDKGFSGGMIGMRSDLYVPLTMHAVAMPDMTWFDNRGSHWLQDLTARLAPGATAAQAEAELDGLMAALAEEYPDSNRNKRAMIVPERQAALHPMVRPYFVQALILIGVFTGLLLVLTCANVAGLLLVRAWTRRRDTAVRLALGANRTGLFRQVMVESIVPALLAGVVALALAQILVPITNAAQPNLDLPLHWETAFNPAVLWFTPLVSLLAGLLLGLMPALEVIRHGPAAALKSGYGTGERRSHRLRHLLVAGQLTVSLVLLIGAGMVMRSAERMREIHPGFDPASQIVVPIDLGLQGYDEQRGRAFYRETEQRLAALPGVVAVGKAMSVPLTLSRNTTSARPEGYEGADEDLPFIGTNYVDHGYFEAMRIPILAGRPFRIEDAEGAPVVIVNQQMADRFWPGQDPIGRWVVLGGHAGTLWEVIGVVPTGRYFSLGEAPEPHFYRYSERRYFGSLSLHIRTEGDPRAHFGDVREVFRSLDPALPVRLGTMEESIEFALMPSRLIAGAVLVLAVLALLLSAVGLYGLIAYSVSQRTRELGVRLALGARPADLVGLVVRKGLLLLGIGVVAGLGLGGALAWGISRILYGVQPVEPAVIALALGVLAAVALMASYLPARRAVGIDPVEALNTE